MSSSSRPGASSSPHPTSRERATLEARAARREGGPAARAGRGDWLTGLHNRRYLARQLERLSGERGAGHCSLAVLDLDHFKAINDRVDTA